MPARATTITRSSARHIAREIDYAQARRRWRRNGAIAGGVVGLVLFAMLMLKLGQRSIGTGRPRAAPTPVPRPRIRLDASGLTIDGTPAAIGDAIAHCTRAGSCDVVVTGDARQGAVDDLLAALRASGVPFEVHG